ncbi:MAG: GIY-YIG nuclease family protein [bacterium]|nr:GIY-YIG nuclease family protein [bacterium]
MPSRRISNWHYVYILQSKHDGNFYIGYTTNLSQRIKQHNAKKNFSTKGRAPLELIYAEACLNEDDAKRREGVLKNYSRS